MEETWKETSYDTIIVGTGAAGYNAAYSLWVEGCRDFCMLSDHKQAGTSRNTGSDKQTYYKLTLSGENPDSVGEMAQTLFQGQCVDGDTAFCEAALSPRCFLRLVELGVPFPQNYYGEYIGYKTDHDPRQRAASAGPYTSRRMTEALEAAVEHRGISYHDNMQVIGILTDDQCCKGVICLSLEECESPVFHLFRCRNLILATGGPAAIYRDCAYPHGQYGALGLAMEAGIAGKNLTEWQYGIASLKPRWNVSGTYMQVMPKFVSSDWSGGGEEEFLYDYVKDYGTLLSMVFLKGYQWPFDVNKVIAGSSLIDILVYLEIQKGRRVYLDYRCNPENREIDYTAISDEAREYLEKADACFGTPYERLCHMNQPAVDFYMDHGVDLSKERLEIALCAQHHNGGLSVDCWWQTNVKGIFAVGETAGTHGVCRPGGSALNAGQVGAMRAARWIKTHHVVKRQDSRGESEERQIIEKIRISKEVLSKSENTLDRLWDEMTGRMSLSAATVRNPETIRKLSEDVCELLEQFTMQVKITNQKKLWKVYRFWDLLICQYACLKAMEDYLAHGGKSRGSGLYLDSYGQKVMDELPEFLRFCIDHGEMGQIIQESFYHNGAINFVWRPVRPLPREETCFETVWKEFRENIY